MMEERYHATTQNRFYPDISNVNKNITMEAKLISSPTYYITHDITYHMQLCLTADIGLLLLLQQNGMRHLQIIVLYINK